MKKENICNCCWLTGYQGVVHNIIVNSYLLVHESTTLRGGRGLRRARVLFLNVYLFVEHNIIKINISKLYYMVLNTTVYT